ncbi:MAG: class GN sortase [Granulosicoccaceae bacterium]
MSRLLIWVLLGAGLAGLLQANYLQLKASLAQQLIAHHWSRLQQAAVSHAELEGKPWAWADFQPVAKLRWQAQEHYVLSSTSGQALAFGPGHLSSSAQPGYPGRSIIAGHNDSHFAFLEFVRDGDELQLENLHGKQNAYKITAIDIVDSRDTKLLNDSQDELLLVTCYPFRSLTSNSPYRLVISAAPSTAQAYTRE